jgi:o-succinylbenzoate synthase
VKIERLELVHVAMPMVSVFESAHSSRSSRLLFLVKVTTSDGVIGWGECASESVSGYSSETLEISAQKIRDEIVPRMSKLGGITPLELDAMCAEVLNANFALAAMQQAVLDAELRAAGVSLAAHLGVTAEVVRPGVVLGLQGEITHALRTIDGYLSDGYARIKFKIEPGRDLDVVKTIRAHVGPEVVLQVDANGAYTREDFSLLSSLDEYGLAMLEQPLTPNDLEGSAFLAQQIATPICLDEGIKTSADASEALTAGAGRIINIKPGRMGGIMEAVRTQELCASREVGCWIGGMLETGVGRTANVVLAGLPSCTHPGDISASRRYFETDLTQPFEIVNGTIAVPHEPGAARSPIPEVLATYTTRVERVI